MTKGMRIYGCYFLLFIFCTLLVQCAQIVTPGGGPKDLSAPHVEKYIPDSAAINFNTKNIVIEFDEFIQLSDLQREMTISPPMNIQPEVKVKGKLLLIEIIDTLKKNTTYVLNFGGAIRDFTENNIKTDFQYIFSTGSYIDTLKLSGSVKSAFDQKTDKGVLVMLYERLDDSVPYKKGPSYFAKTAPDGSYRISNIRPGKYKAFALKETNANYLMDAPDESIAFADTLIKITKNTKLDLRMFKEEPKMQRLVKDFVRGYGSIFLAYSKPVSSISYKPMNKGTLVETFITEYNTRKDTIQVWFPSFGNDSLHFQVTTDKNVIDTIKICTCLFDKTKQGRGEGFKLSMTANVNKDKKYESHKGLSLNFNHPLNFKELKLSNIYLSTKSKRIDFTNSDSVKVSERKLAFKFPVEIDSTYQLHILPGTIKDIFNLTNDTLKISFQKQEDKFYGTLKLILKIKAQSGYLLDLMNEKGEIFLPASTEKENFSYSFLPPGNYKLRIIYDENRDGKWTTGNYIKHTQPEKVIYYPAAITIRSNRDSEIEWKVE